MIIFGFVYAHLGSNQIWGIMRYNTYEVMAVFKTEEGKHEISFCRVFVFSEFLD